MCSNGFNVLENFMNILGKKPVLSTTVLGYKVEVFDIFKGSKTAVTVFNVHGTKDYCTAMTCVETMLHTCDHPFKQVVLVLSNDVFGNYLHDVETTEIDNIDNTVTESIFRFMTDKNRVPKAMAVVKDNVRNIR